MSSSVEIFIHGLAICKYKKKDRYKGTWEIEFIVDDEHRIEFYDHKRSAEVCANGKKSDPISFADFKSIEITTEGDVKEPVRNRANKWDDGESLDFNNVFDLLSSDAHPGGVDYLTSPTNPKVKIVKMVIDRNSFFYSGSPTLELYELFKENPGDVNDSTEPQLIGRVAKVVCIRIDFHTNTGDTNKINVIGTRHNGTTLGIPFNDLKKNKHLELHFNNDCSSGCKNGSDFHRYYQRVKPKKDNKQIVFGINENSYPNPFPVDSGSPASGQVNCFPITITEDESDNRLQVRDSTI